MEVKTQRRGKGAKSAPYHPIIKAAHKWTRVNPAYSIIPTSGGDSTLSYLSNYDAKSEINRDYNVVTEGKYLKEYTVTKYDPETGELYDSNIEADTLMIRNSKRRKQFTAFVEYYECMLSKRAISIMHYTLTRCDRARISISKAIDHIKNRYSSNGAEVLGFVWVLELSEENNLPHYHLLIASSRINFKGDHIPNELCIQGHWGQKVHIQPVSTPSHLRAFPGYFTKRADGILWAGDHKLARAYGRSQVFK